MRDILDEIRCWVGEGTPMVIARVIAAHGSVAPAVGSAMAVSADGRIAGSVSGGCVEEAVISEAHAVFEDDTPRVVIFGPCARDERFLNMTCGGTLEILLAPAHDVLVSRVLSLIDTDEPFALATVVAVVAEGHVAGGRRGTDAAPPRGPRVGASLLISARASREGNAWGSLGGAALEEVVAARAGAQLQQGSALCDEVVAWHYGINGEDGHGDVTILIEVFATRPRMVICGAADAAAALCSVARMLGYRVTVCDVRPRLATQARFPQADEVVIAQPAQYLATITGALTPRDAICVLTHDPTTDEAILQAAVASDAGYIGAMGSRATSARRRAALVAQGVTTRQLARIMSPVGLDIGARTAHETAVSIGAEIIALRAARPGSSLRDGEGSIHPRVPPSGSPPCSASVCNGHQA